MLKKRTRETYEELPSNPMVMEDQPVNNNNINNNAIQNIGNTSRTIKNIKPDTEYINDKTLNILMNHSKQNTTSSSSYKDVEFTNPNIPSNYFNKSSTTEGSCRSCDTQCGTVRECPSCYNKLCPQCAHCCESCTDVICSFCCVVNENQCNCDNCSYDKSREIDYCIDCNYNSR